MSATRAAWPTDLAPTATTTRDLLERAHTLKGQYLRTRGPVAVAQWESFDQALYRLLVELLSQRTVGPGPVDRAALPLYDIVKAYPTPLAPLPGAPELTPADAGRLIGCSTSTIRARILRGEITATRTSTGWQIPHHSLDLRSDVRPADPTDPQPLARIAVTLGVLTDVLHEHQRLPEKPDLGTGPLLRLAHDVLRDTDAISRHTLALIEPDGVGRVLAITRHVAASTARLARAATEPLPYAAVPPPTRDRSVRAALSPSQGASTTYELGLLDRALADWTRAARSELAQSVPSVEVIGNITSHGVHLYATLDALVGAEDSVTVSTVRAQLRATAQELQRAGAAWGPATTTVRPSPNYVEAAQQLHDALQGTIRCAPDLGSRQRERAFDSLTATSHDMAALMREIGPIPGRLIDAGILFAHARAVETDTDRLRARLTGRLVTLHHSDLPDVEATNTAAQRAMELTERELCRHLAARRQPALQTEPSLGPQL